MDNAAPPNFRCGFVGAGNIAFAVLSGVLQTHYADAREIRVFDPSPAACARFAALSVPSVPSIKTLIAESDIIFLAVKPQVCAGVLADCRAALDKLPGGANGKTFVSVVTGTTIAAIHAALGHDTRVVRVMPNTPLLIAAGATSLCHDALVKPEALAYVEGMFARCGITVPLDESLMNVSTAAGGSMPAFAYQFIRGAVTAAIAHGLDEATARRLVAQSVVGAGQMVLSSNAPLDDMIAAVASPGGTTVAGMAVLDAGHFEDLVASAVSAATHRAKALTT